MRANETFTENYKRLKDIRKSVGIIEICGMCASCPAAGPVRIVATIKLSRRTFTKKSHRT